MGFGKIDNNTLETSWDVEIWTVILAKRENWVYKTEFLLQTNLIENFKCGEIALGSTILFWAVVKFVFF